jgi:GNAT superfamily N-acetyltransferase
MSTFPAQSPAAFHIRPLQADDRAAWQSLWDGYNAFYERTVAPAVTEATWARLFDPAEPVHALVAVDTEGGLLGLAHHLSHRSTALLGPIVYLEDLFTAPAARQRGVARALIEAVYAAAREAGAAQVYWQTHRSNASAQALYRQVAVDEGFIVYSRQL